MTPTGLTTAQAKHNFEQFGPNQVVTLRQLSPFTEFLFRFRNPLVLILLVAAIISAFVGDWVSAIIIILIVIISVLLDFFNTYRSERAAQVLKEKVRVTAAVKRDGIIVSLPLESLVPKDVVLLEAGDLIPADGTVVEAKDFYVNESSLTGESFPLEKEADALVYMGASVVSGTATVMVTGTGRRTQFSHIAADLSEKNQPTEFDRTINRFSLLVMKLTFVLVIFIFFCECVAPPQCAGSIFVCIRLSCRFNSGTATHDYCFESV